MVARYAPPISYNFLNLIHLGDNVKTTFEKVMVLISSFLFCCSVFTTLGFVLPNMQEEFIKGMADLLSYYAENGNH
jgi:hypothetical protein